MNGFAATPRPIRQRPAGLASTAITNELARAMGANLRGGQVPNDPVPTRLFLCLVNGSESGVGKYTVDVHAPGTGVTNPLSDSLGGDDLGFRVFEDAMLSASGDLATGTILAGWLVGYTVDGRAALVSLGGGGGASLPELEYQHMVYGAVTDNQIGGMFVRVHAPGV